MDNRYLRDRADRRRDRYLSSMDRGYNDMRRRRGRDMEMDRMRNYPEYDRRMDSRRNSDYRGSDYGYYDERYDQHYRPMSYEITPRMDYGEDYDKKEYAEELEKWIHKLKKHDRFTWKKEQVIQQAKSMGVRFEKFDEDEFYAIYLMHISDYPQIANEPHTYLAMAKSFLEDDDIARQGSEKVCAYLFDIVLAKD